MPSSARGWFCWATLALQQCAQPQRPRLEYDGIPDWWRSDRRETALSVKMAAERASVEASGDGVGYELLARYFIDEVPWCCFTERERQILEATIAAFSRRLVEAGFLPDPADPRGGNGGSSETVEVTVEVTLGRNEEQP